MSTSVAARAIVSDTSPLQYLFQIDHLHLLPDLYREIIVPHAVAAEIGEGHRRGVALPQLELAPWILIRSAPRVRLPFPDAHLGPGELATIALARRLTDCLVILDDGAARAAANRLGLRITGTLGVLLRAKQRGLIPAVLPLVDQLQAKGFRLDPRTRASVLSLSLENWE